jgi:hypothetical protein
MVMSVAVLGLLLERWFDQAIQGAEPR